MTDHSSTDAQQPRYTMDPMTRGLVCPECGESTTKKGSPHDSRSLGLHRRYAHGIVGKFSSSNPEKQRPSKAPAARGGEIVPMRRKVNGSHGEPTTLEVALAVLGKLSPDGRVAVSDLPELLAWIESTHHVVELTREPPRRRS